MHLAIGLNQQCDILFQDIACHANDQVEEPACKSYHKSGQLLTLHQRTLTSDGLPRCQAQVFEERVCPRRAISERVISAYLRSLAGSASFPTAQGASRG